MPERMALDGEPANSSTGIGKRDGNRPRARRTLHGPARTGCASRSSRPGLCGQRAGRRRAVPAGPGSSGALAWRESLAFGTKPDGMSFKPGEGVEREPLSPAQVAVDGPVADRPTARPASGTSFGKTSDRPSRRRIPALPAGIGMGDHIIRNIANGNWSLMLHAEVALEVGHLPGGLDADQNLFEISVLKSFTPTRVSIKFSQTKFPFIQVILARISFN